ncbi:hypothetical protein HY772_03125 [Candidatus Woesearchaeota archaeon]|nr:hypothetical protein [Candidatus Woesearchaeota archaeon]
MGLVKINQRERDKLLKRAKEHIFSTGMNDAAATLAQANMQYGLAKIHWVQKEFGMDSDATFIGTPDETITRNVSRWNRGVSYGGKVSWGSGKEKFIVLDVKPNACGMIVGALGSFPTQQELLSHLYKLQKKERYIDGVKLQWDFNAGNHFIDVFKVDSVKGRYAQYMTILHGGCGELKHDNVKGFGFYFDESPLLQSILKEVDTPWGVMHILEGSNATEYMKFHDYGIDFSQKRRVVALKEIFGTQKILTNKPHQYMLNYNEILLGCQHVGDIKELHPVSIRADLPSYLMFGKKNFTKEQIQNLGWEERSYHIGANKRLRNANLLPHGGGYSFPDSLMLKKIYEIGGQRFFDVKMINEGGRKIIRDPRSIPFSYRGNEVALKTVELGMGEIAAELHPLYALSV